MAITALGAFSGFAVRDLEASRAFYSETLGFVVSDERGGLRLEFHGDAGPAGSEVGNSRNLPVSIFVYVKPDHEPAVFTILNILVVDIDSAAAELEAAGVTLLRYEGLWQDEKGIARDPHGPSIAWFTDPSGNILAVFQSD